MEWSGVEHNRCGKGWRYSPDEKYTNRGCEITWLSISTWNWIISQIPFFFYLFRTTALNLGACRFVSLPFHCTLWFQNRCFCPRVFWRIYVWMFNCSRQREFLSLVRERERGGGLFHLKTLSIVKFCTVYGRWIKYDSGIMMKLYGEEIPMQSEKTPSHCHCVHHGWTRMGRNWRARTSLSLSLCLSLSLSHTHTHTHMRLETFTETGNFSACSK